MLVTILSPTTELIMVSSAIVRLTPLLAWLATCDWPRGTGDKIPPAIQTWSLGNHRCLLLHMGTYSKGPFWKGVNAMALPVRELSRLSCKKGIKKRKNKKKERGGSRGVAQNPLSRHPDQLCCSTATSIHGYT
ncbi:hypothetical protein F5X96DRAFT_46917 [Biscogniauxia mediterranea]|nr:hypothetical protein F5X96DRAFT_46917 [Biscogniauxia mediterranea]